MKKEGVIFLLENSTDYLFSLDQALRRAQVLNPLRVARYGDEAILYLKGVGIYADRRRYPLPSLIIIDLNIPDASGPAVLDWLRRCPQFDSVPVILLEGRDHFVQETFEPGANAYNIKRNDFAALAEMIKSLGLVRENESPTESDFLRPLNCESEAETA